MSVSKPKAKGAAKVDPLADDFRKFVFAVWKHLQLPDPTPVQYDIAHFLQHGPKRVVIQAFRGVGKSWITTAFALWTLYRNPQLKIMVVSANATKANEFSTFAKQLINDVPFLSHLRSGHDQRTSILAFDVGPSQPDPSPSVKSVGITGQLTGSRADIIIADDIEVPHNSDTQGKRERILELIKEFDAVLKPKPGSRIVYLGTPQTEQTVYNTLPERGYVIRIWPARIPAADHRYGIRLAPIITRMMEHGKKQGTTTDPDRFGDTDLLERELSYGRSGFALQFMLDTSLSDADKHPLKLSDLIVYPLDHFRAPIDLVWASSPDLACKTLPNTGLVGDRFYAPAWVSTDFAPYEGSVMYVDPSGRGKDETSYAVVKMLHGRLFLTAAGGFLGEGYSPAVLMSLLQIAKKQDVKQIICEPNYGGGMFTRLLQSAAQNYYNVGIEDGDWSAVAKEQRVVDTLEPVLNQHRLVVCPSVIQHDYDSVAQQDSKYAQEKAPTYRLFYQLARMVRQKGALSQDDRLDALAGAVAYWMEHLARDTERAALDHKQSAFDAELAKFMDGCMGLKGGTRGRQFASTAGRRSTVR